MLQLVNVTNTNPYIQTPYNYHRALVLTAVMTVLSHLDPEFGSVFAIEAINEPIMDATQTPNYGTCMYHSASFYLYPHDS
jgi:hypothetical protein